MAEREWNQSPICVNHWHIVDVDCLVNAFYLKSCVVNWTLQILTNSDEYESGLNITGSSSIQKYTNNTCQLITSWANTLMFPPSCGHAFSGRSSSPVLLYVNGPVLLYVNGVNLTFKGLELTSNPCKRLVPMLHFFAYWMTEGYHSSYQIYHVHWDKIEMWGLLILDLWN